MRHFLFKSAIICLFFSCQPNAIVELPIAPEDRDLEFYIEKFRTEAEERGRVIDFRFDLIEASIEPIEEDRVAGQCSVRAGDREITIDSDYWRRSTPQLREWVVFHELGHCYLGRGHRDDQTESGICRSVMNSGTTDCRINYRSGTREAYLDELFRQE